MSKLELLAPAGDFECLKAAVQSGADAVYFAGKSFGARSFAKNFTDDEIKRAIEYCNVRGVGSHITVNTAYLDSEISEVLEFVNFLYKEGASAVIVSDFGAVSLIKKYFPEISVHLSTQATIHNLDGVKFAEMQGADRVVLSRELPFKEIDYISNASNIGVEIFAHGALCMSYSGQCLLSSMIGKRSGNRGECAQPCRLPFGNDNKKSFILSLKDLSVINHLENIKNSKVCSLKIEGRMKGPQYVSAVVSVYRKYLDRYDNVSKVDFEILENIFNRGGLTDGYFEGKKGKEMFCFTKPDNPYLKQSSEIISNFDRNFDNEENVKIDVSCKFSAFVGENPQIILKNHDEEVCSTCESVVEKAQIRSVSAEEIKSQLVKTGGTPFNISEICVNVDDNIFLRKSDINELRRNAIFEFEKKLILDKKRNSSFNRLDEEIGDNINVCGYTAFVSSIEQLEAVISYDEFKRIYISPELVDDVRELGEDKKKKIVLCLPEIVFDSEIECEEELVRKAKEYNIESVMINNYSQLKYSCDFEVVLSHRFNIWNSFTLSAFKEKYRIKAGVLSPELSFNQIRRIKKPFECECIIYGYIPVMLTENCILNNLDLCPCDGEFKYIIDRKDMEFPVKKTYNGCRNVVYNSVPVYLADKSNDIEKSGCLGNMYFTVETKEETIRIINEYFTKTFIMPENFTRGHYYK